VGELAEGATAWALVCLVVGHGVAVAGAFVAILLRLRQLAAERAADREDLDDLETWSRSVEARWNRERERTH
jgi:hypothetical protein